MFRIGFTTLNNSRFICNFIKRSCSSEVVLPCDTNIFNPDLLSNKPFPSNILSVLNKPLPSDDIEVKPDGIIYLPEIRYRQILNSAFGNGGWAFVPRGNPIIRSNYVIREYALYCLGNFVSQAIGEQASNRSMSEVTAIEAARSTALVRCCKDLGIGNELWDPRFIQNWKKQYTKQVWCVNERTNDKRLLWRRTDRSSIIYPWVEQGSKVDYNTQSNSNPNVTQVTSSSKKSIPSPNTQQSTTNYNPTSPTTPGAVTGNNISQTNVSQQTNANSGNIGSVPSFPTAPGDSPNLNTTNPNGSQQGNVGEVPSFPSTPGTAPIDTTQSTSNRRPVQEIPTPPGVEKPRIIPTKVSNLKSVDINLSDKVPDIIVANSPYQDKTWQELVNTQEGKIFLTKLCSAKTTNSEIKLQVTSVLSKHLTNQKNKAKQ